MSSFNPYESPETETFDESGLDRLGPIPAGSNSRFFNFFIDGVVLAIVQNLVGIALETLGIVAIDPIPIILLGSLIALVFYYAFESTTQRTPAKYVTGTLLVNEQGERPTNKQVFIRSLARLIPLEFLSYWGVRPRGLHDTLSKTFVIKLKELPDGMTS